MARQLGQMLCIAIIGIAMISFTACGAAKHTAVRDRLGDAQAESVFAQRASTAALTPLPSRGCRLGAAARTQPTGEVSRERSLTSGGHTRHFLLDVPAQAATTPDAKPVPIPLVLNIHGLMETPGEQQLLTKMQPLARERGWAMAWPEGIGYSWNAGVCCGRAQDEESDDVRFIRDLVAQLGREMCLDLRRVYATGMSNGGFMSYRLACEASDLIAAVAPVAGVEVVPSCTPSRPVPLLAFNGTSDLLVPHEGRPRLNFPSADESIGRWRARNRCSGSASTLYQRDDVSCSASSGCTNDASAILCTIDGGGHTWPGGMGVFFLGKTSDAVDASSAILDFFAAHARE